MKKQMGYTLAELVMVIWILLCLVGAGFLVYAAIHFILKFW
jgi:type II secretory pathway pseudopilin PulG